MKKHCKNEMKEVEIKGENYKVNGTYKLDESILLKILTKIEKESLGGFQLGCEGILLEGEIISIEGNARFDIGTQGLYVGRIISGDVIGEDEYSIYLQVFDPNSEVYKSLIDKKNLIIEELLPNYLDVLRKHIT